jgi:endonuclease/exonuclease/phosphatase (EEP) superfamily protein YafD
MLDALLWYLALSLFGPLAVLTFAPLMIRSGQWFVRTWDFPRLQLAALTIVPALPLIALIIRESHATEAAILLAILLGMALLGLGQMLPFTGLWRKEVADLDGRADDGQISILVANICYESDQHDAMRSVIEKADPDVMLLIEVNDVWSRALDPLRAAYPHRVESVADEGLGLVLWSRLEMRDGRIEHIMSERRPAIFADIQAPDSRWLRFVGLHPTPPGLRDSTGEDRRDSRVRDGELVLLARHIADDPDHSWIVAGDFNDVAWSHTTRLFKRLSGLLDPRVGRRLLNTYHAERWLLRFPVDHLFLAPGLDIGDLHRIRLPGSDHFGVLGRVGVQPLAEQQPAQPEADREDQQEGDEAVEEGVEDAQERSVAVPNPGVAPV